MKALTAPHCTHLRKGSAIYFLVRTVSVIKVLCGLVQMLIPSHPTRSPWVTSQGRRELAAHTLISSYFHTATLIHLCFPCDIHRFPMEWAQRWVRLLQACSLKHTWFMSPSPEHLAKMGVGERGVELCFYWEASLSPSPFAVVRLFQPNREKSLIAHPEHPAESWKELLPWFSWPWDLCGSWPCSQGLRLGGNKGSVMQTCHQRTHAKKKASTFVLFFPVLAVVVLFLF